MTPAHATLTFPAIRDEIALASMLERLDTLIPLRDDLREQYAGLFKMLKRAIERGDKDTENGLKYELYNPPSGEYGDKGGIAWQLATADARVEDVYRDSRYVAWRNATTAGQDEIIELGRGA